MRKLVLLLALFAMPSIAEAQVRFSWATPVLTATTYTTGQLMGTGGQVLTFSNIVREEQPTGTLMTVCWYDKNAQAADVSLVLLRAPFSSSTTLTNAATFDPDDTDLTKIIKEIPLVAANRFQYNDNGIKCTDALGIPVENTYPTTKKALFGVLISRGSHTAASASDITVGIAVVRD